MRWARAIRVGYLFLGLKHSKAHFAFQAHIIQKSNQKRNPSQWRKIALYLSILAATMEVKEKWAICYKGKVIPVSEETIRWIKQDLTEVWGWFETDLMVAWKNLFPLTERSKQLGYFPMKDDAWIMTPNPW